MPFFVFLHVLTMFVAVAMAYGPAMLMVVAAARNDVRSLRGISETSTRLGRLVIPAFGLGIGFGFVAIFVHGFDPLAGWLVLAYILAGASLMVTSMFTNPWLRKVQVAVKSSPDDAPSAELSELLNSPRNRVLLLIDALIIVALIADMVLKPFPERVF